MSNREAAIMRFLQQKTKVASKFDGKLLQSGKVCRLSSHIGTHAIKHP